MNGDLGPGDQLRAARDLAKDYGVTLVKVQNAYRELSEEGLVFSQQGRGTFVVDPAQSTEEAQHAGSAFIALATEINAMHETIRLLAERVERVERAMNSGNSAPAQ